MKKYILLLFLGATITVNAQVCLDVPAIKKEQTEWCWAASSKCVLDYYRSWTRQCEIAEYARLTSPFYDFGSVNCCYDPLQGCNQGNSMFGGSGTIEDILVEFGNITNNPNNQIDMFGIEWHLNEQHPLIAGWETMSGPYLGHVVVIFGINDDDIDYMEPDDGYYITVSYWDFQCVGDFEWRYTIIPKCSPSRGEPCDTPPTPTDECNNCILDEGEDAIDCGGECKPCKYIGNVTDSITITNSAQLRPEMKAFNKITACDATTVASGQDVTFITEEEGSIVLLPGFKAEEGSNFSTQRKDLSKYKRLCGAICYGHTLSSTHKAWVDYLRIYNLLYAVRIGYSIYKTVGYAPEPIYSRNFNIESDDVDFALWDCVTNAGDGLTGIVEYRIEYGIVYCNDTDYLCSHNFTVDYSYSKSLTEEPEEPETSPQFFSPNPNNIPFQSETEPPNFTILPNPNPGVFQLETNFPLSEIAHLKITTPLGVSVYETKNLDSNTIQLYHSASGMFFVVMVLKDGNVLTQKMMVQR